METNYYSFGQVERIEAPRGFFTPLLCELYRNFTFTKGRFSASVGQEGRISIGEGAPACVACPEGDDYRIEVTESGIGIAAKDAASLIRAFTALLTQLLPSPREGTVCRIPVGTVRGHFPIRERFIHVCVFPENSFFEIRQRVRLLGLLQYTHLILEFWGTVPFASFPAGNWASRSLTEEQVRCLAEEGKALGMEMIPALNCLGHASGSRGLSGKHVVLDQHPEFADLFTPDGWCFEITNPKVFPLLAGMREDLNRLFGHPKYFHLGCDEADFYEKGYVSADVLADYYRALTADAEKGGQIPMVWGDSLLPSCFRRVPTDDKRAALLLSSLSPRTVICDWDYHAVEVPMSSTHYLKQSGHPVIGCGFLESENLRAHVETAIREGTDGVMVTTWHRFAKTPVLEAARMMGFPAASWSHFCEPIKELAMLARKALPGSRYEEFGTYADQLESF